MTVLVTDATYLASDQALADLRALNARFIHNFVTNDVDRHDALLHPRFVCIQGDGSVLDRSTYLELWVTGFAAEVIPYWDTRDEDITVVGDVGLVRSTNVFTVVVDGVASQRASRYTDTYLYSDGRWWCLQAQLTPVQPEFVPSDETLVSVYLDGLKQ